jgi:phosphoribosylformylglycinamidine cyclo-ligase
VSYRDAGVDLEGADRHTDRIAPAVTATWGPGVVGRFGGFAAGVTIPPGYDDPVLMLTTDGVGTKLELARRTGRWAGVGYDLVAMCVDDLAASGARPLAFVDYMAVGALDPMRDTSIVESIAAACADAGCALVGGETAEHPGVMDPEQVDLAGTALGVVNRGSEVTGDEVSDGDVVLGIASPNLRSNGFSLVRAVFADADLDAPFPGEDRTLGEVLLEPSVLYAPAVLGLPVRPHALAHITGGGLAGNLARVLPPGLGARIDRRTWTVPQVFDEVARRGDVPRAEMERTFNMGIGFCVVVDSTDVDAAVAHLDGSGHQTAPIGRIVASEVAVVLED